MFKKYKNRLLKSVFILYTIFLVTCIEPSKPEFDFINGLITVDAIISNEEGVSFVRLEESELNPAFNIETYVNTPVNNAQVTFINTNTLDIVNLTEDIEGGIYLPPTGFVATVGDTWELDIKLLDGRHYKSLSETIKTPIQINEIEAVYDPEIEFSVSRNAFIPGHSIRVDFDDPPDENNYYFWNFKSWETKTLCLLCSDRYYRNGICDDFGGLAQKDENFYVTYLCEVECWRLRYNESIEILDDEFVNGASLKQIPVANVLLYTKEDILIELRQFSISQSAYKYYKTLKDIVDNNGGLNAPPATALVGNLFNVNDNEDYVLGRFTGAGTSGKHIFIEDRYKIEEKSLVTPFALEPEDETQGYPPGLPAVYFAPCEQSFYSTSIKPNNWPN